MKIKQKIVFIIFFIIILLLIELENPIYRHYLTRKYYFIAKEIAKQKNKKLIVIGDPCCGNNTMFIQNIYREI
jgi:hypothetical protein